MSRLDLVVGPNGAGKSTYIRAVLEPHRPGVPLVDADLLAAARWPDPDEARHHAFEAARLAEQARTRLLERRRELVVESILATPAQADLAARARQAGYHVHLHVLLVPDEVAVHRVRRRAEQGGRDVPAATVRERARLLWPIVAASVAIADTVEVFDNSGVGPRTVARFVGGELVGQAHWPAWSPVELVGLTVHDGPASA